MASSYRYRTFRFDFMKHRTGFAILSAVLTFASLIAIIYPGPKYGIDFAGGTNIIVRFQPGVTDADVRKAIEDLGISDPSVQRMGTEGEGTFLVQTGAVTTIAEDKRTEMAAAISVALGPETTFDYNETSGDRIYIRVSEDKYGGLFAAEGSADAGGVAVKAKADELRGSIQSALQPVVGDKIAVTTFGGLSDRKFVVQLQSMQTEVDAGLRKAFGDKFVAVDRVETVGPRVGAQLRADGVRSALYALLGILIYVAIRFDLRYAPGAVVCLAHDVIIMLGVFVLLGKEVNLPILAAALTLIGYSLNDTIVNYDRIRENLEIDPKANLVTLVNRSINEVLTRTVLTAGTTLIATLSIYLVGGGLVRDFAFAMLFGIIFGTYSSIYVSNTLMIWTTQWLERRAASKPARTSPEIALP
jgi:preprotein translocase subunit SecF